MASSNNSRRTFSSPYLASLNLNSRTRSQYRPGPRPGQSNSTGQPTRSRYDRPTRPAPPPPRGSRSAPPNFSTANPELHEFFQRRAELHKEVQRTLLQSKLDNLVNYQQQLEREIKDLERGCGEAGIFPNNYSRQNSRTQPVSNPPSNTIRRRHFNIRHGLSTRVYGRLVYKVIKKPDRDGKTRSFSLEVDVKGFKPENIEIESEDATLTIKCSKLNGMKRELTVNASSSTDIEKAYVHYPRVGVLVIDF